MPVTQEENIKVGALLPQVGTRVSKEKCTYCYQEGPMAPHNVKVIE